MAEIRTSFIYDPIRQGYDTNSWRTISGNPAVVNGRLSVDNAVGIAGSCIHYVDFVKGDISFDVNVPTAPVEGTTRMFGVSAPNTSAYIRFVLDDEFTCEVSDGINTSTSTVDWDSDWTGANIIYRIIWESGLAKFFVDGTLVATISSSADFSSATYSVVSIPYGPLSLYLYDGSETSMTVGDINVRGTQSYVLSPKTSDTTPTNPTGKMSMSQNVTISESVTTLIPEIMIPFVSGAMFDLITVSENITITSSTYEDFDETVTVAENIEMFIPELVIPFDAEVIDETVTVSEDIINTVVGP